MSDSARHTLLYVPTNTSYVLPVRSRYEPSFMDTERIKVIIWSLVIVTEGIYIFTTGIQIWFIS